MPLRSNAIRTAGRRVDVPTALGAYVMAWVLGNVASLVVLTVTGHGGQPFENVPIWAILLASASTWTLLILGMWEASKRSGTADFVADYRVRFRPVDLLGVPIGVLSQLVLLPVIYLPLERIWESTFTDDKLSQNAQELVDRATGGSMVLLVLMACVGAPVVEELVYRGLLQGSFAARFAPVPAWLAASALFALIHFRPVEYPGLFAIGLVFGGCAILTGRLGMAMACHLGFNVTGLILALN